MSTIGRLAKDHIMSTVDRIQTRHPNPAKAGANFDAAKYWAVREAILRAVPATGGGLRFADLSTRVAPRLSARAIPGGGSIGWYVTTVKLDLEARSLIARLPGATPRRLLRTTSLREGLRRNR